MTQRVLWVVGEPGVGKTTLVRRLIEPVKRLHPKPKWTVGAGGVVAAGHYTGAAFDGADTVPYNGAKAALEFWREVLAADAGLTILDGDRFSNLGCRNWFVEQTTRGLTLALSCLLLTLPQPIADVRRAMRGSRQNPAWVKGRKTKADRFYTAFPHRLVLPAVRSPEALEVTVREWLLEADSA